MPVQPDEQAPAAIADTMVYEIETAQQQAGRLPLPENNQFRYWVDSLRVRLLGGKTVFHPVRIEVKPGCQGTKNDGDATSIDGYQRVKLKRIEVPLDFEVKAWGKRIRGYQVRKSIGRDRNGKQLWHYHDVWTRYIQVGNQMVPEFDQAGFDDFCKRVEELVGRGVHEHVDRAHRVQVRNQISEHRRLATRAPGAAAEADRLEKTLTPPRKRASKHADPPAPPPAG